MARSVLAWLLQATATPVVPKRQRVGKERFETEAEALSALDRLATAAATGGLP